MGIILRQSFKGTIYVYAGVVIGFLTNSLIFPKILTPSQIGLINILIAYGIVFAQFGTLGFNNVTIRLFPYFRNDSNGHNGFLFLALSVPFIGFLLVSILFLTFKSMFLGKSLMEAQLLSNYFYLIIPLIFVSVYLVIFDNLFRVLYNATMGMLYRELFRRILILIVAIFLFINFINFHQFVYFFVVAFGLPTFLMIISLIRIGQFNVSPQLKFLNINLIKNIFKTGLFGVFSGTTNILTLNIERIILTNRLGLSEFGIYITMYFFGTLVVMPSRTVNRISSVIISESWKNNDIHQIKTNYFKTCLNQFWIGLFILLGVWLNIHNILFFLPEKFEVGEKIVFFIGLAYMFNMISGSSDMIITTSDKYQYITYMKLLLLGFIVFFNILFIPHFGIMGPAYAAATSYFLFSALKFLFLYYTFGFQPYNFQFIKILGIGIIAYFLAKIIPVQHHFVLDAIIRSTIFCFVYGILIIMFNISEDVNESLKMIRRKIRI